MSGGYPGAELLARMQYKCSILILYSLMSGGWGQPPPTSVGRTLRLSFCVRESGVKCPQLAKAHVGWDVCSTLV